MDVKTWLDQWKTNLGGIMWIAIMVLGIGTAVFFWQSFNRQEERYQQAVTLNQEMTQNIEELKQQLHITHGNAQMFSEAYERGKNKQPTATFYVQAPTLEDAAKDVEQRIHNQDNSLPTAVLEKSDRTAIVANTQQQKVDVIKITLDKARLGVNVLVLYDHEHFEAGIGPSWKNLDTAVNIGVTTKQRAYVMGTSYY
jgi:hypothetical protein